MGRVVVPAQIRQAHPGLVRRLYTQRLWGCLYFLVDFQRDGCPLEAMKPRRQRRDTQKSGQGWGVSAAGICLLPGRAECPPVRLGVRELQGEGAGGEQCGSVGPGTACWPPSWDDRTLSQGLAGHTLAWGRGWGWRRVGSGFALRSGRLPEPWPQFLSRLPTRTCRRKSVTLARLSALELSQQERNESLCLAGFLPTVGSISLQMEGRPPFSQAGPCQAQTHTSETLFSGTWGPRKQDSHMGLGHPVSGDLGRHGFQARVFTECLLFV